MNCRLRSAQAAILSFLRISLLLISPLLGLAQPIDHPVLQCGTESLSPDDRRALEAQAAFALQLKQASGPAVNPITYIPIRPHIIRKADGTGGYSLASLNNVMALTNKYYLQNGNGIQFYFSGTTPDYIDNDALYAQYRQGTDDATVAPRDVNNALNQYFVHQFDTGGLGGYAQFPYNSVNSTRTVILDENYDEDMGNRLVPHELGHTFNLLHTHEPAYGYERVTRGAGANCTTAGDLVCDTPADPYGRFSDATASCVTGCPPSYTCTFRDDQNNVYTPSPTNIMSYYFPCIHDFTPGQYDRIQAGLAIRQQHTAYTLDAPETVMTAPSNVVARPLNSYILITWQDNATNEMGYFIERSTQPTSGFAPIGGVQPNVTSFTDVSYASNTHYYYRIRASNTTTGSISPTASILSPVCRPAFTSDGCPYAIILSGVAVNGTPLSQNSGCSPATNGYYTSFTAVSGTVTAGQTVPFTVTKGNTYNQGVTIWVDLNNNGIFETSERLYQLSSANTASVVSGSLTIPANTLAGTVAMRVVTVYALVPTDPCGSYSYGETEDYQLVINPVCSVPTASLDGNATLVSGQAASLTVNLAGTAPFSLTVTASGDTAIRFVGISVSPFSFTVAPTVSTTYTLSQVNNSCGMGTTSGAAVVTVTDCPAMYTLKDGSWDDPTVWSCNHVPTPADVVQIGHAVVVADNVVAKAQRIVYAVSGTLTFSTTAQLILSP